MLADLFTGLSGTLSSSPGIALAGSCAWGVLSVVLSPCHLASIPLVVGFIDRQGRITTGRSFALSLIFASGILVTIGCVGLVTGLLGRMLGDIGGYGGILVAGIFFIIGLHLLGVLPLPFMENASNPRFRKKGPVAAFILGLLFGLALGPCSFAFMAPILGIVFSVGAERLPLAVSLIAAYAVGHCLVIVLAGTFTGMVQQYLDWNESTRGAIILRKICGVLVIIGGIYLLSINLL